MSELSVRETAARALWIAEQETDRNRAAAARYWDQDDLCDAVIPRPIYRHQADAVLAAVADHDGLAGVLRGAIDWDFIEVFAGEPDEPSPHPTPDALIAHLADVVRAWLRDQT